MLQVEEGLFIQDRPTHTKNQKSKTQVYEYLAEKLA